MGATREELPALYISSDDKRQPSVRCTADIRSERTVWSDFVVESNRCHIPVSVTPSEVKAPDLAHARGAPHARVPALTGSIEMQTRSPSRQSTSLRNDAPMSSRDVSKS